MTRGEATAGAGAGALEWQRPLDDGRVARAVASTRAHGDLGVDAPAAELAARRRSLVDLPWVWLRQVHGAEVVVVADVEAGRAARGARADALVTTAPGVVLAVQAADCAPVALVSRSGVVGAVHAGWRGVEAGVLEAAVAAMRALGADDVEAALFPCIHVGCNEFGAPELDRLAAALGPSVRGRAATGGDAFDLPAAVGVALAGAGVVDLTVVGGACTACDPARRWYSHRGRRDAGRHALAVWVS